MATEDKTQVMASSSSRPLSLKFRPDITFERQLYQGREYWVAKDPINLKYYRFEEEEYFLLQLLDGCTSPDQIKRRFDFKYAPQKITMQELYQFVGMLYRSCLLLSDASGQGVELKSRGARNRGRELRASLSNILAVRFKGFDPDTILTLLDRWTWWFFTWPAFLFVLLLGLSAAGLVFTQFEQLTRKLPAFQEFFAADNWLWLMLVMGLTKIMHEFGHGLACKRFGGQCHEMGVMLLVLTPCLYCNVSDSWTLTSKWKRAMIAAAGMYVELILSAIAVFVWWFSQPGLVNQLALNIVVITSVSTILFNANPLLRYDGYYILSDLMEIPNLRQKATKMLQRTAGDWLLGMEAPYDPFLPVKRKWFFMFYSVAAVVYRWLITFSIFWFLYQLLEPYGVKVIGQMIALMAIWGLAGMPLFQLYRFFSIPGRWRAVKPLRAMLSSSLALAVVAVILIIPIPHFVYCDCFVRPLNVQNVYVDIPGRLTQIFVEPNQRVQRDQPLVQLKSPEFEFQLAQLEGRLKVTQVKYASAIRLGNLDSSSVDELDTAKVERDSAQADFEQRQKDESKLIVRAPTSGLLLAPAIRPATSEQDGELRTWTRTPLDPQNLDGYLEKKTLLGRIVPDPTQMEVVLAIDQGDIEFVKQNQKVEIFVDQLAGTPLDSTTTQISPTKMKLVPRQLSSRYGGSLVTTVNESGEDVPQSTTYLVSVKLDNQYHVLDGATGVAKIRTGSQTVGQRIWRSVCRTFRFEL